jgi:branched-chain amino acid transport system substrate-binding protein
VTDAGVTPVRVGMLFDYIFPPADKYDSRQDIVDGIELSFEEAAGDAALDRPYEFVSRDVRGLPNGSFKDVVRAFHELVAEDCVVIFGPLVSENAVPLRRFIDDLAEVPVLSMMGSESFLGPWTFALNNGSLQEEPSVLAAVITHDGIHRIGVAFERSLVGAQYLDAFRRAAALSGLEIVREVAIPQVEADKEHAFKALQSASPEAIVHVGFGHGLWGMNDALRALDWDPPKYTTTAFELAYFSDVWMHQLAGFIGLDQYDERNDVGQRLLDRFDARFGRRPEYYAPGLGYDIGRVLAQAVATASPLTGAGVRDAIERVKMLPAASGAPGTRIRFGQYLHQGWMGAGYLTARRVLPSGDAHVFHGTIDGTVASRA